METYTGQIDIISKADTVCGADYKRWNFGVESMLAQWKQILLTMTRALRRLCQGSRWKLLSSHLLSPSNRVRHSYRPLIGTFKDARVKLLCSMPGRIHASSE